MVSKGKAHIHILAVRRGTGLSNKGKSEGSLNIFICSDYYFH